MNSEREPAPEEDDVSPESSTEISLPSDLLEAIPEARREDFLRKYGQYLLEVRREEHYSGPLQPAREASAWNELVEGSAKRSFDLYERQRLRQMEASERILTIVEERARHDIEMEKVEHSDAVEVTKSVIEKNSDTVMRGQLLPFVGALLFGAAGFYMVHLGHDSFGIAVIIAQAASFAAYFLYQHRSERNLPMATQVVKSTPDQSTNDA